MQSRFGHEEMRGPLSL